MTVRGFVDVAAVVAPKVIARIKSSFDRQSVALETALASFEHAPKPVRMAE